MRLLFTNKEGENTKTNTIKTPSAMTSELHQANLKRAARKELRIRGVSNKLKQEIRNLARYHGITECQFLRQQLTKLADAFPEHMKIERNEDE